MEQETHKKSGFFSRLLKKGSSGKDNTSVKSLDIYSNSKKSDTSVKDNNNLYNKQAGVVNSQPIIATRVVSSEISGTLPRPLPETPEGDDNPKPKRNSFFKSSADSKMSSAKSSRSSRLDKSLDSLKKQKNVDEVSTKVDTQPRSALDTKIIPMVNSSATFALSESISNSKGMQNPISQAAKSQSLNQNSVLQAPESTLHTSPIVEVNSKISIDVNGSMKSLLDNVKSQAKEKDINTSKSSINQENSKVQNPITSIQQIAPKLQNHKQSSSNLSNTKFDTPETSNHSNEIYKNEPPKFVASSVPNKMPSILQSPSQSSLFSSPPEVRLGKDILQKSDSSGNFSVKQRTIQQSTNRKNDVNTIQENARIRSEMLNLLQKNRSRSNTSSNSPSPNFPRTETSPKVIGNLNGTLEPTVKKDVGADDLMQKLRAAAQPKKIEEVKSNQPLNTAKVSPKPFYKMGEAGKNAPKSAFAVISESTENGTKDTLKSPKIFVQQSSSQKMMPASTISMEKDLPPATSSNKQSKEGLNEPFSMRLKDSCPELLLSMESFVGSNHSLDVPRNEYMVDDNVHLVRCFKDNEPGLFKLSPGWFIESFPDTRYNIWRRCVYETLIEQPDFPLLIPDDLMTILYDEMMLSD